MCLEVVELVPGVLDIGGLVICYGFDDYAIVF